MSESGIFYFELRIILNYHGNPQELVLFYANVKKV